jgi:hypothetical protein
MISYAYHNFSRAPIIGDSQKRLSVLGQIDLSQDMEIPLR